MLASMIKEYVIWYVTGSHAMGVGLGARRRASRTLGQALCLLG